MTHPRQVMQPVQRIRQAGRISLNDFHDKHQTEGLERELQGLLDADPATLDSDLQECRLCLQIAKDKHPEATSLVSLLGIDVQTYLEQADRFGSRWTVRDLLSRLVHREYESHFNDAPEPA